MNNMIRKITLGSVITALWSVSVSANELDLSYDKFTLDNGLRVIVHEDRKAPIVAVSVWYHVGSKDEPRGKTGFAHLFEHMMYRGSENFSGSFFDTLNNVGASNINGTTSYDRTNYFQTMPTAALELALWLESDRMGHLLGAVTQQTLDDERSIVQNEKRQAEARPYGGLNYQMMRGLFPEGHPYHHSVIGSMDDLNRASLEDVHSWFKQYYGAANALVVLSGDIDVKTARPLMEKYFADIAPGPPLAQTDDWVPERRLNSRETMYEKADQTIFQRAWVVPGFSSQDKSLLDMVASVLGGGRISRLYTELIEKQALATDVSVSVAPNQLASVFTISVAVKSGVDLQEVEQEVDKLMTEFLTKGPSQAEVDRIKSRLEVSLARDIESVHAKAQLLAEGELYAGDAEFVLRDIQWTREASRKDVREVARTWLSDGYHQISVLPFGDFQARETNLDRSRPPEIESAQTDNALALDLPVMQEATLSNGIKLVLAERHESDSVDMTLIFENAGSIAESGIIPGTANATFALMNDGPTGMSSKDFVNTAEQLGAWIGMQASTHDGQVSASMLKKNLAESLTLWARAIRSPAFREEELERMRVGALQGIRSSRENPGAVADRILSSILYGPEHPYAPLPEEEEEQAVLSLNVEGIKKFHRDWVRPDRGTLLVVGATTMPELVALLEKAFDGWMAPATAAKSVKTIESVEVGERARIILVNQPNLPQTTILAGRLIFSSLDEDAQSFDAANSVFGAGMSGRIGVNLRVQKGWSYGASSGTGDAPAQRLWQISAPVQTDKTAEAMVEILKEMKGLTGEKPVTEEELSLFVRSRTLVLPGVFESGQQLLGTMVRGALFDWQYDWVENEQDELEALKLGDVNRVAQTLLKPETLTWVLVGDLKEFEQKVRNLNLGDVEVWSSQGEKIR